ncbi:hypothetical protein [Vreelandella massiliensis]|uniref:hypothetical protein n=1 Tax=Vreelandella massiliensis TaxID=1816686 RepID=UPI00096A30E3|nr:hypothetical protein [Halomonas massiliensis]
MAQNALATRPRSVSVGGLYAIGKALKKRLKANGLSADVQLECLQRQLKQPFPDDNAVKDTRWTLFIALKATVVTGASGSRTKYKRQ